MGEDAYGAALRDFHALGALEEPLLLHGSYGGDVEEMPVEVFFREEADFPELEHIALALCDGRVLDVGAGAGSHALFLQRKGLVVDALDLSESACAVMRARGVRNTIHADFFQFRPAQSYDTLLFLMNGIGLAGSIDGLHALFRHSATLLAPGGQLLFDSSDVSYLYTEHGVPKPAHYPGQISYRYAYKDHSGEPFDWLYIDQETLIRIAHGEKWVAQILFEDENGQYLARMERM